MTDTSPIEREWEAQEPSPGFAERVVAAAMREQRPSRKRYVIAGAAIAAAAAAAVAVVVMRGEAPSRGEVVANRRIEVPIGTRAVAVLEAGAHIKWNGNVVEQPRGDVFYRVDKGGAFSVRTPAGDADVLGTCFRITVEDKMGKRDLGAGAIGAVAAAVIVVGVYEGKVRVSHGKEAVTVGAGERAIADGNGVRSEPSPTTVAAAPAKTDDGSARTAAMLRDRIANIENEKAELEKELAAAHEGAAKAAKSPYDLSPEDWAKLAEDSTFKYQMPCFQKDGFRPNEQQLARLGLAPADADAIQQAYRNANKRFAVGAREICAGKPEAELSNCLSALFTSMYQQGTARDLFKQVAEIRAGKRAAPADADAHLAMLLLFSGQMKAFEDELAQTFGAEEAHRLAYSEDMCFQANTMR